MSGQNQPTGAHQAIRTATPREQFAAELFDRLWDVYRSRVQYVETYERVVEQAGATFVNDHIAFRTFATQRPLTGISSLSRIFDALGYRAAETYHFEEKHLFAQHFQHPHADFPKLFISELKTWELSEKAQLIIQRYVDGHRPATPLETLTALATLDARAEESQRGPLLAELLAEFHELPWSLPEKDDVLALNEESQYAAWVLVHGYEVNHFTSLVNSHGTESLNDLDKTVQALRDAGVPMKPSIEGEPGSKLRQTATEAVKIHVPVRENGTPVTMRWTYAYFELAERNLVTDPETGQAVRFEGFLGPQATHLFEMTRMKR